MKEFSIKQIESFTGVKAHTLRAWEQRYGFFTSKRKKSNVRYFTLRDLHILMKVCFLHELGYKLQKLDNMSRDEIDQTINSHILQNTENANIQKLLILTIQLDIDALENLLNEITENHDFDYVLTEILWPFLNKIGILWNTTVISPRHENMVTEILRRKIYAAIDGSCTRNYPKKLTALLFCAENEYNDIPLLSLQYLLQKKGIKAINLGTDLPTEELQYIKHKVDPEIIIMHGTSSSCKNKKIQNTLNKTIQSFPDARIIISGQRKKELDCMELPDNTLIIENVKDIQKSLF